MYLYAYGWGVSNFNDPNGCAEVYRYDRAADSFLRDLDHRRVPELLLRMSVKPDVIAGGGDLLAEIRDYRSNYLDYESLLNCPSLMPNIRRVMLRWGAKAGLGELLLLENIYKRGRERGWTERDWVGIDSRILSRFQPPLCLVPSTEVFHVANAARYNTTKFSLFGCKRRRHKQFSVRENDARGEHVPADTEHHSGPGRVSLGSFLSRNRDFRHV